MGLSRELTIAVAASQSGIRINTDELHEATSVISELCEKHAWELRVWDCVKGLQTKEPIALPQKKAKSGLPGLNKAQEQAPAPTDIGLFDALMLLLNEPPKGDPDAPVPVLLVVKNFHLPFERNREGLVTVLQHLVEYGKANGKFVIGLMPQEALLPPEVEPLFHVVTHELPDEEELTDILYSVVAYEISPNDRRSCVKAAMGLTRLQAEGVFAASIATTGKVQASDVWKMKADILNKEGLVELRESKVRFSDVGGLLGAKDFVMSVIEPDPLDAVDPDSRARGVLLVGPPGTGKSLLAYCTGNEMGIPTLLIDVGKLKNQYVGASEARTRKMFQIVKRMSPNVTVIDEVNLALGGSGKGEHSVDRNMLGSFLTNLNDITEPVFWMFTSNDVEEMHEAIFRAERIDAKIYVRLPSVEQRAVIWRLNIRKFFPATIAGKPDARYIELDFDKALVVLQKSKLAFNAECAYLGTVLQAMPPDEREVALQTLSVLRGQEFADDCRQRIIDDEGWTGAEIRACCRLARRRKKSLFDTQKIIGHVAHGSRGRKIMERLDRWAKNEGALDSETGELFTADVDEHHEEAASFGRVRRKAKQLKK